MNTSLANQADGKYATYVFCVLSASTVKNAHDCIAVVNAAYGKTANPGLEFANPRPSSEVSQTLTDKIIGDDVAAVNEGDSCATEYPTIEFVKDSMHVGTVPDAAKPVIVAVRGFQEADEMFVVVIVDEVQFAILKVHVMGQLVPLYVP